jgi:transcription elongation factor Elf1
MYENKAQVLEDIDNGVCPKCGEKVLYLDEEGMEHEALSCKSCGLEVYIGLERKVESVSLYDKTLDEETEIMKK